MHTTFGILFIGLLFLAGYIIYDVLKNKKRNFFHRIIKYSCLFYITVVLQLTLGSILIPPQPQDVLRIQLVPFYFIQEWMTFETIYSWHLFNTVRLTFFNFIMLLPLGVYAALLFSIKSLAKATLIVFLSSLFIETSQLVLSSAGLIWMRGFNVDDLIMNTLGGVIGFLLAGVFKNFIRKKDNQSRQQS